MNYAFSIKKVQSGKSFSQIVGPKGAQKSVAGFGRMADGSGRHKP